MTAPTSDGRRVFLRNLLAGAATAGAVMIFRQSALAALAGDSSTEEDGPEHDYAFIVDVNKCIGCGNCVKACRIENDVPEGQFRTWIERYVVTDEGVHVDTGLSRGRHVSVQGRFRAGRSHPLHRLQLLCHGLSLRGSLHQRQDAGRG